MRENLVAIFGIFDLLPNELAGPIAAMIDQGMAAMKKTLDRDGRRLSAIAHSRGGTFASHWVPIP